MKRMINPYSGTDIIVPIEVVICRTEDILEQISAILDDDSTTATAKLIGIKNVIRGGADVEVACNVLKSQRKNTRERHTRSYRKSITIRLSVEEGRQLSTRLRVAYDPKTDAVTDEVCLSYYKHEIFPGTNQPRICYSDRAIQSVEANRRHNRLDGKASRIYAKGGGLV